MKDSSSPLGPARVNEKYPRLAGRLGVVAAIVVFVGTYIYGIATYGLLLGIGLGWLPCGAIAWVTAIMVASIAAPVIHWIALASERLPLLLRQLRLGTQHRH